MEVSFLRPVMWIEFSGGLVFLIIFVFLLIQPSFGSLSHVRNGPLFKESVV